MPFDLTNAPSTFQSLMNSSFYEYLRKFILVFFDDILVYNTNWMEHMEHLRKTREVLRGHKLYVRRDKVLFWTRSHCLSGACHKQGAGGNGPYKDHSFPEFAKT